MSDTAPFPARTYGVLLHPSSLPGPEGIGTLGAEAEAFVDWLASTGAGIWQILPLTPNGKDDSPYFATSAFAGNPWLVDLRRLADAGLLDEADLVTSGALGDATDERIDFATMKATKWPRLAEAAKRFLADAEHPWRADYERFVTTTDWLADTCHFFARKDADADTPWWEWEPALRRYEPDAVAASATTLAAEIAVWQAVLFFFEVQWQTLRRRANEAGLLVLGDIPIYVAPDSVDVWTNQAQFQLDAEGRMTAQSGVPPDYFSETGQLWGNPLYRWDAMEADGFSWWIDRLRRCVEQTDLVRVDHFRALSAYWSVPAEDDTAIDGEWVTGPGQAFIDAVVEAFPEMPLVAEDLGDLDDAVLALRDDNDLVGMRVLQFGFDSTPPNEHHPSRIVDRCIVYTGTHDNDTMVGWWESLSRRMKATVRSDTDMPPRVRARRAVWWLIGVALSSPAVAAVVPFQDLAGLGGDARMNVPGTTVGNWDWRLGSGHFTRALAAKLRSAAIDAGRITG